MGTIVEPTLSARVRDALFPREASIRKIAIPVEHGGWGILFEPIVLALLAAFSLAGVFVALGAVAAFFARQPLKTALVDRARGKSYPRTRAAWSLTVLFGAASAILLLGAAALAGWSLLAPLAAALPLALVPIVYDARNDSRQLFPELAGAVAMSAIAMSIALAGAAGWAMAAALWLFMVARSVPAILYVRARVRLARGLDADLLTPVLAHAASAAGVLLMAVRGAAPWVGALASVLLVVRCALGLSPGRRPATARRIGFTEIGYGAATVIATGVGYLLIGA